MAEAHAKNHDYHIVDPSPWPFVGSVSAFIMAIGAIMIGSLLIGGILYTLKRARILLPVFLIIIPTATLGSLVGGLFIGSFLARANDHLIFLPNMVIAILVISNAIS